MSTPSVPSTSQRLARLAASVFQTPGAFIGIRQHQRWRVLACDGALPLSHEALRAVCAYVHAAEAPLCIPDCASDDVAALAADDLRFLAGTSLPPPDDGAAAVLCAVDPAPRTPQQLPADPATTLRDLAALAAPSPARPLPTRPPPHALLDDTTAGLALTDAEGRFVYVNAAYADILGYTPAELHGEPFAPFLFSTPQNQQRAEAAYATALASDAKLLDGDWTFARADGAPLHVYVTTTQLTHAGASFVLSTVVPFAQHQQLENRRKAEEAQFQDLVQSTSAILWRGTPDTFQFTYVSPQAEALLGYPPERWLDEPNFWQEHMHPDDRAWAPAYCARATEEKRRHSFDYRMIAADGSVVWLRDVVSVLTRDGQVDELVGVMIDITELKDAERQRKERERRVEALYKASRDLLATTTADDVAELILTLVDAVFGYSISAVRLREGNRLVPYYTKITSDVAIAPRPVYAVDGASIVAEAYRTGDTAVYDDVTAIEDGFTRAPLQHAAYIPIGRHGIISVASVTTNGIDPFDVRLLEILAQNAEAVLDRITREDTLRAARDEAQELSRMKSAFLANMSHEVRTPLTSIIGFAELIETSPEERTHFTRLIRRGARRLLDTLNAVLDFSQLEAGARALSPQLLDIGDHLRDTFAFFEAQARQQAVAMTLELPPSPIEAHLDPDALQHIIQNLLNNALKFTPQGGQVTLSCTPEPGALVFAVADSGVGIDPAVQEKIFEPFVQESTGNRRTHEGSGLGLSICKRLVDLMGGDIAVESTPGDGTTFTVRLPQEQRGG